jgi:hypothetical protein
VLLGDRGEHEDADERLAFGGALSPAERVAVSFVSPPVLLISPTVRAK